MSNELIINSTREGCRIALLKDKRLVEFHQDGGGQTFNVGDIYLGSVKKVVQGLNAAFIDLGYEKDAFLHYLDLGPQVQSLNKFTKLTLNKKLNPDQVVLANQLMEIHEQDTLEGEVFGIFVDKYMAFRPSNE